MDNKSMLAVLNHILDELEASTNPSLIPTRLHELKMKLHTFVHDVSTEMAKELDPVAQDPITGTPAQANASHTGRGGLVAEAENTERTPEEINEENSDAEAEDSETQNDSEEEAPEEAPEAPESDAKPATAVHARKPLFDRKKKK